jgi:hypothetical protein
MARNSSLRGVRIFGRDELSRALTDGDLGSMDRRIAGLAQFVSARKPE